MPTFRAFIDAPIEGVCCLFLTLLRRASIAAAFSSMLAMCTITSLAAQTIVPAENASKAEPAIGLDQTSTLQISQSVVGKTTDDFTLLDREGRPVRLSQYRGKPLLVSFIYTGCFQVCPLTTRSLQSAIKPGKAFTEPTSSMSSASVSINRPTRHRP